MHGLAVTTVEGIGSTKSGLHPVQVTPPAPPLAPAPPLQLLLLLLLLLLQDSENNQEFIVNL